MMGHRDPTSQDEYDAFNRKGRRFIQWRRGEVRTIKRRFARRMRRVGRAATRAQVRD
ncbi:hypothetical protein SAMN05421720_1052 [Rhodospira trueperi]|uniref:Uncharacterized protein n=1 Tax=Rhodospira trueperi TaxID=69960 RepID=A0A1G7BEH4_9PROT|nr:hypothetical protein SAMN05421720_1052 [Rhodospira trueperi]